MTAFLANIYVNHVTFFCIKFFRKNFADHFFFVCHIIFTEHIYLIIYFRTI